MASPTFAPTTAAVVTLHPGAQLYEAPVGTLFRLALPPGGSFTRDVVAGARLTVTRTPGTMRVTWIDRNRMTQVTVLTVRGGPTPIAFAGPRRSFSPNADTAIAIHRAFRSHMGLGAGGQTPPPPQKPSAPFDPDVSAAVAWVYATPQNPPYVSAVAQLLANANGLFSDLAQLAPSNFTDGAGALHFGWSSPGVGYNAWQTISTDALSVVSSKSPLSALVALGAWATSGPGLQARMSSIAAMLVELNDKRRQVTTLSAQVAQLTAQVQNLSAQVASAGAVAAQNAQLQSELQTANAAASAAAAVCAGG